MKPTTSAMHRLCLFLVALVYLGTSHPLLAAPGGRRSLSLVLASDRLSAQVKVPKGVGSVTVEKFERLGGWQKFATKQAVSGVMKFRLPVTGKEVRWRATGRYEVSSLSRMKFPAKFYTGESLFGPIKSTVERAGNPLSPAMQAAPGASMDSVGAIVPEEADIWKTDGSTVYFFNQLRGLQVLDLTNPADPLLTASLRLPAVGQDLYLLPGSGDRRLVLLTESWSQTGGQSTRINLVKVSGSVAEIIQTQDVPGNLEDSRLAGNRLILATTEWNAPSADSAISWTSSCRLSEWLLTGDQAPQKAAETLIDGANPLISSGPDWLAVAAHPNGLWDISEVSVFAVRPSGLVLMAPPFRTVGAIANKFAMNWSNNVFTTVSQKNWNIDRWSPTTTLENFRVWSPEAVRPLVLEAPLGKLELAKGESLFATRFANDKAYIVTFLRTDPLWVVDLSDPMNPTIAGQIEVPGWSSHLEPIGDLLFSIGWEAGTVAASLFDVEDPTSPKLLRRINLGNPGTYSEALWDEKALKVLPDAGLALIPLTSYDSGTGTSQPVVQLLDIDVANGELTKRGSIAHAFEARRADLIGGAVVSISQRVLVAAEITDRDAPAVLSEVTLAWPVDRVLEAGKFLVQIEDGGWYSGGTATARISPANAPESILTETDLGEGTVKAADIRDGKLYVLRELASAQPLYYWSPIIGNSSGNQLILDIYDTSAAPALSLLGSCAMTPGAGGRVATDHLLWPQANRPAVVMDFNNIYWYGWGGPIEDGPIRAIPLGIAVAASPIVVDPNPSLLRPSPYPATSQIPQLVIFDTTLPKAPVAAVPVDLGTAGTTFNGTCSAADGLIVLGMSQAQNVNTGKWYDFGQSLKSARVIEVRASGAPVQRPSIELPGELFGVTELDSKGFLAFTRKLLSDNTSTLQVSASDGYDAFLVTGVSAPAYGATAVGGRRLFIATDAGVQRQLLGDNGKFLAEPILNTSWQPYSLRWLQGRLIGSDGTSLFQVNDGESILKNWKFTSWYFALEQVTLAGNGDLLVPFGQYGAERLSH
ncbi:MAG: beta-propeller domain-containing protein [Luteolibacter sp.]